MPLPQFMSWLRPTASCHVIVLAASLLLAVPLSLGAPVCQPATIERQLPPLGGRRVPRLTVFVGDTVVFLPPANWTSKHPTLGRARLELFWLRNGTCPRGPLQHEPLGGVLNLSPTVNRFGRRLVLTFDAPGTYLYTTTYATSCLSGRVLVRVRARALDCPPLTRPGCNYDGTSPAANGARTLPCFCAGLVGYFPSLASGCAGAISCTGLRGVHAEYACPAGQKWSAVTEKCEASATCGPPGTYFAGGFLGAYPDGQKTPQIPSIPAAKSFYHILSFAREDEKNRDGNFKPKWDTWTPTLAPETIIASKLAAPNRRFMLSIAGWGHNFRCPSDRALWLVNAVNSLYGLTQQYFLDGVDINYEGCPLQRNCKDWSEATEQCFAEMMGELIVGLKGRNPSILITASPYFSTWPAYKRVLQTHGSFIPTLLWQSYTYKEASDTTAYLTRLHSIANDPVLGSYSKLTWGVCTTNVPFPWRGLQAPYTYDAYRALRAKGVQGFFTWSLEDSSRQNPPYVQEATMQLMS